MSDTAYARRKALVAAYGLHVVAWRSWKWRQVWGPGGTAEFFREDLTDLIWPITPSEVPLMAVFAEWQSDALAIPISDTPTAKRLRLLMGR
jgi:hypothetical protein